MPPAPGMGTYLRGEKMKYEQNDLLQFVESVKLMFNEKSENLTEILKRLQLARNMELIHSGVFVNIESEKPQEKKSGGTVTFGEMKGL